MRLLFIALTFLPGFAWSAGPYSAAPSTGAARFLLLERPDAGRLMTTGEEEYPGGAEPDLDGIRPAEYSPDAWNNVREQIETGRFNPDLFKPVKEIEISTEAPTSPPPEVEFKDSGTSLSVTGRKVIALNYTSKRYLTEQVAVSRPRSLNLFEITQQMQVRMQGKVGSKITVNVDYDDTKLDKQDISVVYQGDPNEVVQNVSFGDIDLSLPATEFVSYNKQVFGIRADLKTKHFKLTVIGSRTKGVTKTKQFTGNTQFQSVELRDVDYLRRKYYDVTFGCNTAACMRLPIKSGTERIYIDQQTQAIADGVTVFDISAKDLAVQNSTYTGRFQIMNPGIDYVIDYIKGLVTFNRSLNPQDVLIIDFENADGTRLHQNSSTSALNTTGYNPVTRPETYVLFKTQSDIFMSTDTEAGYNREVKTYYNIGQTNIVHDDGHGSFILKVRDLNRREVGSTLNPPQTYPGPITVDFEQGVFNLDKPFAVENDTATPDPQLYSAAPVSKRIISVEYSYRFKTFMLEPNIVTQSDNIRVNGVKVNRNEDYFIDYDSGFITFYYPERLGADSKIDIIYEVSPFGGIGNQSLVGGRISYDMNKHFSIGSTMLYQGGIKSNTVPNITDLTNSMLVYEGDAQLKGMNLLGLKTTLGGEVAQSRLNPNLNGSALVDNMEGIKQDDSAGLDANHWQIAANPGLNLDPAEPDAVTWVTQEIKSKEINAQAASDGTQQVLAVNYDFSVSSEVSIVYPLSPTGLDFSQKTALELVAYSDNATGPQFNLHLGQISEDADGTGGQNFVCSRGITVNNAPKSEDTNCDGQLAPAEDVGWAYSPVGKGSKSFGAGNGRMDSADLNKNGRMDTQDFTGGDFGYVAGAGSKFTDNNDNGAQKNTIDFTGWHTLFAPIPISSTDTYKWTAIKQVRISLKYTGAGPRTGVLKFARIAAVGNSWTVKPSATVGTLQVLAKNNIDNPDYKPLFLAGGEATDAFNKLYGSVTDEEGKSLSEQTLVISYSNIASTSTGNIYRKFSRPIDVSQHKKFMFLFNNQDATDDGARFFIQMGDENNYYRAEVPLNTSNSWRLITLEQTDINKDGIPDAWFNGSNYTVYTSSQGSPSFQAVPQIIMGITVKDGVSHSGTVYVNELHVAEPIIRVGNARKAEGSFEIPGWMTFGGKHRYVDRNFQTPVTAITNQDNEQQTGYLNITRLAFLPMNFTAARQLLTTPNASNTGANNLVASLQEGKVKKFDGTAAGTFNVASLPRLGFNYTKNRADYSLLARRDEKDVYSGNLSYALPFNFFALPTNIGLNYSLGRNQVSYNAVELTTTAAAGLFDTDERTDVYGAKLSFVPWRGSSFNPGYSLSQVKEKRFPLAAPEKAENYPKSMQQTAEFNSNFRLLSWFNPGVNYSITTMENNNLNVITITQLSTSATFNAGEIKSVNRTAQGGVSLTLNAAELVPRNRLLRSMIVSSSYQIQDGDTWQNIEKGLDAKRELWLRDSLHPKGFFAQRNSVTLRDTINSSQRWQPFEGFGFRGTLSPLNTVSISNNFTNSVQRSEVTGTITRSINRTFPDLIFSISQLEILTRTSRWAQNETVNLKYSRNTNETKLISLDLADAYGVDFRLKVLNYFDTAMSYNLRLANRKDLRQNLKVQSSRHQDATFQTAFDYRKFRFTPKVDYVFDIARGGLGVITQQTEVITPSLLIKADTQLPKGLKLPFIRRIFAFTNRITWTTTLSYAMKKSPITLTDNNRLFTLNSSADYEAAKNLRLTFNAGIQRFWHKYLKEEEYISYQGGSTLTFQF